MDVGTSRSRQTGLGIGRRGKPRQPALRFAALLALLLQVFLVQTHIHPASLPLSLGVERAEASDNDLSGAELSAPDDHQVGCVLCEVLAASGAVALPDASSLVEAESARSEAAILALAQAPRAHSHYWRSRAPPSRLST
jgi:hypothetical protein